MIKKKSGPQYTVGITFNIKKGIASDTEDMEAEYDSLDTIYSIQKALEGMNCKVLLFEADISLPAKLQSSKIDIVFNIAEGAHGRGRESHVPALLNFLGIPFTGSDETTLAIALDKVLTKKIVIASGLKTPKYQLIKSSYKEFNNEIRLPAIVKPNAEGSSKGISDISVARDMCALEELIDGNISKYGEYVLVEEYIEGREFTVGIIGNGEDMTVLPPMEIKYKDIGTTKGIYSYNVKKNYKQYIDYACPAEIDKVMENDLVNISRTIYDVLGCKDFARIDYRLSLDGYFHFIEANPLPGLAPGYSDYPMIAEFSGIDYERLISYILNCALKRHGMEPVF